MLFTWLVLLSFRVPAYSSLSFGFKTVAPRVEPLICTKATKKNKAQVIGPNICALNNSVNIEKNQGQNYRPEIKN